MKTITLIALAGNKKMNEMATAFDALEPSKAYAKKQLITLTIDESKFDKEKGMAAIKKAFEAGEARLVCLVCNELDYLWYDESVISVSDGEKWFLLKDFLKRVMKND